jgi:ADP-ribose pyrophosphatase YjhB (NUDIX family)
MEVFVMNDYDLAKTNAIEALKSINPMKPYGTDLFNGLARLTVTLAIEAVCLRFNPINREYEVYLTQRSLDESAYPDEWHCPGSTFRVGETEEDVFDRLSIREFGSNLLSKVFVAKFNNTKEARGHFFSLIYLCNLQNDNSFMGRWFPVNWLPKKIIDHHRDVIIPMAVKAFMG